MTIGDQFQLSGCNLEEIVRGISDGEFDVRYLENFEYRDELRECCFEAIAGVSAQAFAGRVSHAKVMGHAMDLLRQRYDANAPRGWYPAMKRLRATTEQVAEAPVRKTDSSSERDKRFRVLPEEILTSPWSAIRAIDHDVTREQVNAKDDEEVESALATVAEQRPEIKALFIELAKEMGVPAWWGTALVFVETALTKIAVPHEILLTLRDELRQRVEYRPTKSGRGIRDRL